LVIALGHVEARGHLAAHRAHLILNSNRLITGHLNAIVETSSLLTELVEVPVHVSSGRPKQILSLLETIQLFQHDQRKNYIVSWKRVNALHVMKENRRINYKNFSGTQLFLSRLKILASPVKISSKRQR
jgi:hypothetical protein